MADPRNIIILILLVAVGVLGYLLYEEKQSRVTVDIPGLKIEAR